MRGVWRMRSCWVLGLRRPDGRVRQHDRTCLRPARAMKVLIYLHHSMYLLLHRSYKLQYTLPNSVFIMFHVAPGATHDIGARALTT